VLRLLRSGNLGADVSTHLKAVVGLGGFPDESHEEAVKKPEPIPQNKA
jgi:hypothetical protein